MSLRRDDREGEELSEDGSSPFCVIEATGGDIVMFFGEVMGLNI